MLANLLGVVKLEELDHFKSILTFKEYESSFKNILLSMIQLVNHLTSKINHQVSNLVTNINVRQSPKHLAAYTERKRVAFFPPQERAYFNDISNEMVSSICRYIPLNKDFFWNYGVICSKIVNPCFKSNATKQIYRLVL